MAGAPINLATEAAPRWRDSAQPAEAPARSLLGRPNNFHGIRLLAALQVALLHAVLHLQVPTGPVATAALRWVRLFPGVPIFFFVSGLLVSASHARHPSTAAFARTRLARVMPGLWACFAVTLAGLAGAGVLSAAQLQRPGFWLWCVAQLTVGQAYNPDFLRPVGIGVINGSLWTIAVELGFYAALPALLRWLPRRPSARLGALAAAFCAAAACDFCIAHGALPLLWRKLLTVTPLAHADLFLSGVLAYHALPHVRHWVQGAGRAPLWTAVYVGAMLLAQAAPESPGAFGLARLALPPFVLACALNARRWSDALLGDTDLSYGLYLYHMLAVNLCVGLGWANGWPAVLSVMGLSVVAGLLSWRFMERPAIHWQRRRAHVTAPPAPLGAASAAWLRDPP